MSGEWLGTAGTESAFLDLLETSTGSLTGIACKTSGQDCYPLKNAMFIGGSLTGEYAWAGQSGMVEMASLDLTLSTDKKTLIGLYYLTSCGCAVNVVLKKE